MPSSRESKTGRSSTRPEAAAEAAGEAQSGGTPSRYLRAVLEATSDCVKVVARDGIVLEMNGAGLAILEAPEPSAVLGRCLYGLVSETDRPSLRAAVDAAFAGEVSRLELVVTTFGGRRRHIETWTAPLRDDGGVIVAALGVARDVTERRAAEERLALALDATDDGLWDWDLTTDAVHFSARWCHMLGYEPEEIEPHVRSWERGVHPDDWAAIRAELEPHLRGETASYVCEHRVRHKNGAWMWILDRGKVVARDADGRALRMVGTHTDVTAGRTADAALRSSEERFRALDMSSPVGIFQSDLAGRITYTNDRARQLWAATEADLLGHAWIARVHPDDRDALLVGWAEALAAGREYEHEYRILWPDGATRVVNCRSAPLRDADGAIVGSVGTVADVTASRNAEERVRGSERWFRALIEHGSDLVAVVDASGVVRYASPSHERVIGLPVDALVGRPAFESVHRDDVAAVRARFEELVGHAGATARVQFRHRHGDGSWRTLSAVATNLLDDADVAGIVVNSRDVTERTRVEDALRESQRSLASLLGNLPGMAYRCRNDRAWTTEFASDGCRALTGYATAELTGDGERSDAPPRVALADLIHPDDRERVWDEVQRAVERRAPFQVRYRMLHRDGDVRWVWEQGHAVRGENGTVTAIEGLILDVTASRRVEEERERLTAERDAERTRLAAIIDQLPAAIVIAEAPSGRVALRNGHVERIFGGPVGADRTSVGDRPSGARRADGSLVGAAEWPLARAIAAGERVYGEEYRCPRPDAPEAWVRVSAGPVRDREGQIVAGVLIAEDVSERKRLEEQLSHQAFHDALTGLANRALFRDRVERALGRAQRSPTGVTVLFLDLDDFKSVNDSLGHGEGDRVLVEVAARLLGATRGCDTVARLGGDEFAVLLDHAPGDSDALVVANRILSALAHPVVVGTTQHAVRASIGIARAAHDDDAEALLRNADVAMYQAKVGSKGACAVFAPEMYEALRDRVALAGDLRHALDAGEFLLAYQPIVDLETEEIIGVEALARWRHPTRGWVPPATFIPVAEESGLILTLGRWVLGEACRQAAAWQRAGAPDLYVAVNISGRQLQHSQLVADVATVLHQTGLRPDTLLLEITESVVMEDAESSLHRLHELKALGVRLAVDDFGTGYSSLAYLRRLPVDVLKIDKSFVDGVANEGSDAALARTIIALGETLTLQTVAEGIERSDQRDRLRALGCGLGQGYLFAKPGAAAEIEGMVLGAAATRPAAARR